MIQFYHLRIDSFFPITENYYFTMFAENFKIWLSEASQIDSFLLITDNYYFTMIDENFEIWLSEALQIDYFFYLQTPWLKKKFKFEFLKRPRFKQFYYLLTVTMVKVKRNSFSETLEQYYYWQSLLYHGWRNFWNLSIWNVRDWFNFKNYWQSLCHHGWRKFKYLSFWNAPDWFISTTCWKICVKCCLLVLKTPLFLLSLTVVLRYLDISLSRHLAIST